MILSTVRASSKDSAGIGFLRDDRTFDAMEFGGWFVPDGGLWKPLGEPPSLGPPMVNPRTAQCGFDTS